jgi:pimeloyl-ACP methyl ester carboxylesterase
MAITLNALLTFRSGIVLWGLLTSVMLSGCAAPIGVTRVTPQASYLKNAENVLGAGTISDSTKTILQRYNLLDSLANDPAKALDDLHTISKTDTRRDILFAMSELNYLQGARLKSESSGGKGKRAEDSFLQSAVYAYFYLLDDERGEPPTAYDKRYRETCDLYNQSLWQAFPMSQDDGLVFLEETRQLVGGPLSLTINAEHLSNRYEIFAGFFPSDSFNVRGFSVRNREAGLGMPLIGVVKKSTTSPNGGALPLTAVLRLNGNYTDYLEGNSLAVLELFSSLDVAETRLNNQQVPLQTDLTAPLAYRLNDSSLWRMGELRFLTGAEVPQRVLLIQPYEPGRIPIVFVHGTASSPVWWAEMVNTLRADPKIRKHFQFWFYQYNSSNLVTLSAAELREGLTAMVNQLDPMHHDPALQNMVVIGHSQGGLLTKMTVVDPGNSLWNAISDENADEMVIDPEIKAFAHRLLVFKPLPFVKRVVFISTPHRGSYLTKGWVRSLVSNLISIPSNVLHSESALDTMRVRFKLPASVRGRIPTSIDGMSEENPLLRSLVELPLVPGVVGHSIIAVKPGMDIVTGNDGVVEYKSAHIEGVESEFIVRAEHSCQGHPFTIEEVRRILLEHIGSGESQQKTPENGVVPAGS